MSECEQCFYLLGFTSYNTWPEKSLLKVFVEESRIFTMSLVQCGCQKATPSISNCQHFSPPSCLVMSSLGEGQTFVFEVLQVATRIAAECVFRFQSDILQKDFVRAIFGDLENNFENFIRRQVCAEHNKNESTNLLFKISQKILFALNCTSGTVFLNSF